MAVTPGSVLGVPLPTFSYLALAVGASLPIICIIAIVITTKIYGRFRQRRRQHHQKRLKEARELLWRLERREKAREQGAVYENPILVSLGDGNGDKRDLGMTLRSGLSYEGLTMSRSNPDVYFQEGGTLHVDTGSKNTTLKRNADCRSKTARVEQEADTSSASSSSYSHVRERPPAVSPRNHPRPTSLDSEQARALECFDKIYEELDISFSSDSDSGMLSAPATFPNSEAAISSEEETVRIRDIQVAPSLSSGISIQSVAPSVSSKITTHSVSSRTSAHSVVPSVSSRRTIHSMVPSVSSRRTKHSETASVSSRKTVHSVNVAPYVTSKKTTHDIEQSMSNKMNIHGVAPPVAGSRTTHNVVMHSMGWEICDSATQCTYPITEVVSSVPAHQQVSPRKSWLHTAYVNHAYLL